MSNQIKIICNDNYLPDVIKPFLSKHLGDSYCRYILIVPVYFAIFIEFIIFSIVFKKLQKATASSTTANDHPSTQPKPAPTDPHSPQVPSPDRRSTWVAST